jgi:hypothetical protein
MVSFILAPFEGLFGCMYIHFNLHVLEWNEIEFSLILLKSTSIHVDWDKYMYIQTKPEWHVFYITWLLSCSEVLTGSHACRYTWEWTWRRWMLLDKKKKYTCWVRPCGNATPQRHAHACLISHRPTLLLDSSQSTQRPFPALPWHLSHLFRFLLCN